jgi:putative ABC transport system permease protein
VAIIRLPFVLLILIYQSIVLALGQIWSNKVRSTLTTIGIIIGIASVTAVVAVLTGLRSNVLSEFESFGTNKIFIFPDWRGARRANIPWQRIMFRPEHFEGLVEHCPSVGNLTRMNGFYGNSSVSYAGRIEPNPQIQGIEASWHQIENRRVVMGREFSLIDNEHARPVCIINTKTQEKLGLPKDPIGETLIVAKTRFLIVGLIESKSESAMFGENRTGIEVFLPFRTVRQMRPYGGMHVIAASRNPEVNEEAQAEIKFFLRKKRGIKPGEPDTFGVEAVQQFVDQFRKISATVTMAATGVVGISLLVGGVGIMNIMLVSVSERTREIGLRKAVGARPSAILLQFLVEAIMLCFLGGLLGVLGGQGLTMAVAQIPDAHLEKAHIPGWALAMSFGFAGAVGLIFGMFPAIKAARLDPIEALRHE